MQKCFECDYEIAKIRCATCSYNLCVHCNYDKHIWSKQGVIFNSHINSINNHYRLTKKKSHNFYLVCEECETRPRRNFCLECDEKFCDTCFEAFHKKGNRIKHPKLPIERADSYELLLNLIFFDCNSNFYLSLKHLLVDYLVNYKHIVKYIVLYTNNATKLRNEIEEVEFFEIIETDNSNIFTEFSDFEDFCKQNLKSTYNVKKVHLFFDFTDKHEQLFEHNHFNAELKRSSSFASDTRKEGDDSVDTNAENDNNIQQLAILKVKRNSAQSDSRKIDRRRKKANFHMHKCLSSDNTFTQPRDIDARSRLSYFLGNSISTFCSKSNLKYPLFHIYNDIEFDDTELQTYSLTIQKDLHEMALQGYTKILFDKFILHMQREHDIPITKIQNIIAHLVETNIVYKQVRQFSKYHVLTFLSLKSTFVVSHENILWVIKALKKDKVSFTVPMILNKIRDIFDLTLTEEYLFDIFDDYIRYKSQSDEDCMFKCLDITKIDSKKYIVEYMNNDSYMSDFLNNDPITFLDFEDNIEISDNNSEFLEFKHFIEATFNMDLLSIKINQPQVANVKQNDNVLTEKKNASNSNNSSPYSSDSNIKNNYNYNDLSKKKCRGRKNENDIHRSVKEKAKDTSKTDKKDNNSVAKEQLVEKKAIPGGKFGFALFTKYFGTNTLKELTIGKILALIDKAIKINLLKYKKTFIYKSDSLMLHEEDPDFIKNKKKLLDRFKAVLLNLLRENNNKINVAQAKELIESTSGLKLSEFEDYGLLKLKNILEELSETFQIVEIKRGTSVIVETGSPLIVKTSTVECDKDSELQKPKKRKAKNKKQDLDTYSNIYDPRVFIERKPHIDSFGSSLHYDKKSSSKNTDLINKIKVTIFKILNTSKGGLEPKQLYKLLCHQLGHKFDYLSHGYQTFYDFLIEQFYQMIDVEIRYITKNEAKYIIYLKNKRFGPCKDDKYLLDDDKIEKEDSSPLPLNNIDLSDLESNFLTRLISEQLIDDTETLRSSTKNTFSVSNLNFLKSSSSTILLNLDKMNIPKKKQLVPRLYAINSLDERINKQDRHNGDIGDQEIANNSVAYKTSKVGHYASHYQAKIMSEDLADPSLTGSYSTTPKEFYKYCSEESNEKAKSHMFTRGSDYALRNASTLQEGVLKVIESIESEVDLNEIDKND